MSKPRIGTYRYVTGFPDRLHIWSQLRGHKPWIVFRGEDALDNFPTHALAIAYADALSRSRPAGDQSPHPPHTRPSEGAQKLPQADLSPHLETLRAAQAGHLAKFYGPRQ